MPQFRRLVHRLNRLDLVALVLLVAILVFRVAWVLMVDAPAVVKDAAFYDNAARWFMNSGAFAISDAMQPSAWAMPGYPIFLAVVYWVFGDGSSGLVAARVIQAVLSVLTIVLLYRVALRVKGRRAGLAVVILAGLYPPFTLANTHINTEVLYTFLLVLVVLLGVRLLDHPSWRMAAGFGIVLALTAYVRPAGVLWGVVPFLLLLRKVPLRRIAALSAIGLLAFALCMSPWWIRNGEIYGRFVPLSASGSDPLLQGSYIMYGASEEEYRSMVEDVLVWTTSDMRTLTPQEEIQAGERYKELAVARLKDQALHHPATFVYRRLNAAAGSFRTPYFLPEWSVSVKKATKWMQFLLLLIPAAAALWVGRKDRRILLLASVPIVIGITYTAILISPRYVFPVMPVVVLMAALGWLWAIDRVLRRARRRPIVS